MPSNQLASQQEIPADEVVALLRAIHAVLDFPVDMPRMDLIARLAQTRGCVGSVITNWDRRMATDVTAATSVLAEIAGETHG